MGWATTKEQVYDADRRYTDHSDKKGHSTQIRVNLPTPIGRKIAELVAEKRIPEYKTPGDVLADAAIHHLHRIALELDAGDIHETVTLAVMLDNAEKRRQELEIFEHLIQTIDDNCNIYYPTASRAARWEGLVEYCFELLEPDHVNNVPAALRSEYIRVLEGHIKTAQNS